MRLAPTRGPHLSKADVRAHLDALEATEGDRRNVLSVRLAWRPAWAIRSRKGAWADFLALFRRVR
ncbi:hypothetical protein [Nisaea sediminum]|uniref:hypothetical protein n=1 Tax=Nisaea sediminum TaxID=2775867 RepID=UPI0018667469|nr:hypothetical protein [Nisaea sediminum]